MRKILALDMDGTLLNSQKEISPKTRSTMVMITVEIPDPASSPNFRTQITVATDVAAMFTMLLPIRMVESSLS